MKKALIFAAIAALLLAFAGLVTARTPQAAQAKPAVDMKKIMEEITGEYDFDIQGQAMTINFFIQDGRLFGAPSGETPESVVPVAGDNPLKFEVNVASNGQHFDLEFLRNDKGVIDKCRLIGQDVEAVGAKKIK